MKETINKVKRQPTEWEMFTNQIYLPLSAVDCFSQKIMGYFTLVRELIFCTANSTGHENTSPST